MAEVVTMPKLGFDMAEGTLIRWVVLEGESVTKGGILAEIETDKATVEVEASVSGVVLKHLVPEGEIVPINTPIAVVGESGEEIDLDAVRSERAMLMAELQRLETEMAKRLLELGYEA